MAPAMTLSRMAEEERWERAARQAITDKRPYCRLHPWRKVVLTLHDSILWPDQLIVRSKAECENAGYDSPLEHHIQYPLCALCARAMRRGEFVYARNGGPVYYGMTCWLRIGDRAPAGSTLMWHDGTAWRTRVTTQAETIGTVA